MGYDERLQFTLVLDCSSIDGCIGPRQPGSLGRRQYARSSAHNCITGARPSNQSVHLIELVGKGCGVCTRQAASEETTNCTGSCANASNDFKCKAIVQAIMFATR